MWKTAKSCLFISAIGIAVAWPNLFIGLGLAALSTFYIVVETHRAKMTVPTPELVADLAIELCKDLDYSEIYELATVALMRKLSKETEKSLSYEYGERYDYVFLKHGVDPLEQTDTLKNV